MKIIITLCTDSLYRKIVLLHYQLSDTLFILSKYANMTNNGLWQNEEKR